MEWYRVGTAGEAGRVGHVKEKLFPLVRYMSVCGGFYGERLGSQAGSGTSDPFWDV